VLVGVRADDRRLRDHAHLALPMGGAVEQASGRSFDDQAGRAITQLGCGLGSHIEVERGVSTFGGGSRLPGLVLSPVLRQSGGELADAMSIVNLDGDGRCLPDGGQRWGHFQRGLAAAGQSQDKRQQEEVCSDDWSSHKSILVPGMSASLLSVRGSRIPSSAGSSRRESAMLGVSTVGTP
jgi:hypothetical protein